MVLTLFHKIYIFLFTVAKHWFTTKHQKLFDKSGKETIETVRNDCVIYVVIYVKTELEITQTRKFSS